MKNLVVGIAAGRKYDNYLKWIQQGSAIEVIRLSHEDNNLGQLKRCDGVVISGGEDVHPSFYRKPEYGEKYQLDDFDIARDEFELEVIGYSSQLKLSMLGICRGLQIVNVFFGGTLIPDIPSYGKPHHTKYEEGKDRVHSVDVAKNSLLENIAGVLKGEVNSAHHQSVDTPGNGLVVNAVSADGIIEGLEREKKEGLPFLMLVQWHPERMSDQKSPFSKNIRESFLNSITNQ